MFIYQIYMNNFQYHYLLYNIFQICVLLLFFPPEILKLIQQVQENYNRRF